MQLTETEVGFLVPSKPLKKIELIDILNKARDLFGFKPPTPQLPTQPTQLHPLVGYDMKLVHNPEQLQNYVTNRLIFESADEDDPRVRLKALELLGKISSVGLFSEKSEVAVTHGTTKELEDLLKAKIGRIIEIEEVEEYDEETDQLLAQLQSRTTQ